MIKKFYKKLSWWKSIGELFLILVVLSFTTGWITEEFYPLATIFIMLDLIINLIFIIKSITRKN